MTEPTATAQDFRRALLAVRDSRSTKPAIWEAGVSMLLAQHRESRHAITLERLATSASFTSKNTALLNYGSFAQLVARELGYTPPNDVRKPKWWMAIATCTADEIATDGMQFTMRPELARAIELMGWVRTS